MKALLNIFLVMLGLGLYLKPIDGNAFEKNNEEVFLKKLNQRFLQVLRDSNEARVFLDEDLSHTSQFLAHTKIKWLKTYQEGAQLLILDDGMMIGLSQHYSFMASPVDQVEILVEFLFQLKRKLEGSSLFIPYMRIKLFAQKYAPIILTETDPCSLSLYSLDLKVSDEARSDFSTNALKNLTKKNYSYHSTWSRWIILVEKTQSFENQRSQMTLTASLLDWKNLAKEVISETSTSGKDVEKALKKLSKQINNQLPACDEQAAL